MVLHISQTISSSSFSWSRGKASTRAGLEFLGSFGLPQINLRKGSYTIFYGLCCLKWGVYTRHVFSEMSDTNEIANVSQIDPVVGRLVLSIFVHFERAVVVEAEIAAHPFVREHATLRREILFIVTV